MLDGEIDLGKDRSIAQQSRMDGARRGRRTTDHVTNVDKWEGHQDATAVVAGRRARAAFPSSVRRLMISYRRATLDFGRSTRPSRWTYSRVAELPLTTMATFASGTSTPSLSTRP